MTHSKVIIRNLRIHGFHGVKQAEKALGQKFEVDLVCELNGKIGVHDQMDETVCYGEICDLVCAVSEADVFNLIETPVAGPNCKRHFREICIDQRAGN